MNWIVGINMPGYMESKPQELGFTIGKWHYWLIRE